MSYLSPARISFHGRFLADVATRNNLRRNYVLGGLQEDEWNHLGGSAFELLNCRALVAGAVAVGDPAVGFAVTGAHDQASAKMVDLDPDWQMASELWGMFLRVVDPQNGELAVSGRLSVCSFRDLWSRQPPRPSNGQRAGGRFVSVLEDLDWGPAADRSPAMRALRAAASSGRLSVGLHTFGYFYAQAPRYRTGGAVLHLGPWQQGEPETALLHRRLNGVALESAVPDDNFVLGDIDFAVTDGGRSLHLDLGHAMPLADVDGRIRPLDAFPAPINSVHRLSIGLRPTGPAEPIQVVEPEQAARFLDIPDDPDWYRQTGGIVSVDIPEALAEAVDTSPLALFATLQTGQVLLASAETEDGVFYRADSFVRRLETDDQTSVRLHARRYGRPMQGLKLHVVRLSPPAAGAGPVIEAPDATDAAGTCEVKITGVDPGNPRGAFDLDGQIAVLGYSHKLLPDGSPDLAGTGLGNLDVIVAHVRDPYPVPAAPEFERHIRPILQQYAQLYPIMSEHLFNISDYDALVANRQAMLLVFSRPFEDPNYMPVTRDLSRGKMETLMRWLSSVGDDRDEPLRRTPEPERSALPSPGFGSAQVAAAAATRPDAKETAARIARRIQALPDLRE